MTDEKRMPLLFRVMRANRLTPRAALPPLQRLILIVLADYDGPAGIYPSIETISQQTGASRSAVKTALAALESTRASGAPGPIKRTYRMAPSGSPTSSLFELTIDEEVGLEPAYPRPEFDRGEGRQLTEGGSESDPDPLRGTAQPEQLNEEPIPSAPDEAAEPHAMTAELGTPDGARGAGTAGGSWSLGSSPASAPLPIVVHLPTDGALALAPANDGPTPLRAAYLRPSARPDTSGPSGPPSGPATGHQETYESSHESIPLVVQAPAQPAPVADLRADPRCAAGDVGAAPRAVALPGGRGGPGDGSGDDAAAAVGSSRAPGADLSRAVAGAPRGAVRPLVAGARPDAARGAAEGGARQGAGSCGGGRGAHVNPGTRRGAPPCAAPFGGGAHALCADERVPSDAPAGGTSPASSPCSTPRTAGGERMSAPSEFRLTPPDAPPEKKPKRTRAQIQAEAEAKRAAKAAAVDAAKAERAAQFSRVRDGYFTYFTRGRGEKPIFGGAEGRAAHTLLDKLGTAEAVVALFERVYSDRFHCRVGGPTIRQIASDPDRFKGVQQWNRRAPLQEPHPGETQHYEGPDDDDY